MSIRPEVLEVSFPKMLEAVGRASGLPLGLVKLEPAELIYANTELEGLLARAGIKGGAAAGEWILRGNHAAEGWEFQTAEVGHGAGGWAVISARLAPGTRLEQLLDRLVRRYGLSASEHKELRHLARGLAIKDSARELGLSPETVRVRRKRVYRKMSLGGHEALLARLCQEALVAPMAAEVEPAIRAAVG